MLNLKSKVTFLFFLLRYSFVVGVVLTFYTHCPLKTFAITNSRMFPKQASV